MDNTISEKLNKCYESIKNKITFKPRVGLVLGSGLGDYAEQMKIVEVLDYSEIEGFPQSTVSGHKGRFVFGYIKDTPIVAMQGRIHFYEGYPMSDVVLPTRLMALMGIKTLILTNAAGGVNTSYHPGSFMMIKDHILYGVPNPLIGPNLDELGPRFPDMSEAYSPRLQNLIKESAKACNIDIEEGVYVQFTGPSYETPSEVKMARILGGDAVGMSTACEAIAANHMGLEVCGISCITNMAAGILKQKLNHKEVQETADKVSKDFSLLVTELISRL